MGEAHVDVERDAGQVRRDGRLRLVAVHPVALHQRRVVLLAADGAVAVAAAHLLLEQKAVCGPAVAARKAETGALGRISAPISGKYSRSKSRKSRV